MTTIRDITAALSSPVPEEIGRLAERLRWHRVMINHGNGDVEDVPDDDCEEAADALDRQARRIAELEDELQQVNAACDAQMRRANRAEAERKCIAVLEWRPIETAPKDGTLFLAWGPNAHGLPSMYSLCSWHDDAGFCIDELREATHWLPLPAPPSEGNP